MYKRLVLTLLFLKFFFFSPAQLFVQGSLRHLWEDIARKGVSASIYVSDPATGRVLVSHNSDLLLAPASTLKTVTTATALEMLGPEYRFKTIIGYHGRIDNQSGNLEGDLIIRGGGDPSFGSNDMEGSLSPSAISGFITGRLKEKGVTMITGDLVLDLSVYGEADTPGSWAWEDIGNYYGAGPSALSFADNRISLFFDTPSKPGEPATLVRSEPEIPWLSWQSEVKSSSVNLDRAYVFGSPWGEKRVIKGTLPAGRKEFMIKASMPDPPRWFGEFLVSQLNKAGIELQGEVTQSREQVGLTAVDTLFSPPLAEIIRAVNHESINLFAEHLVLQIALEKGGKGSYQQGLKLISDFWQEKEPAISLIMEDGSGLSRFNAVSANSLCKIVTLAGQGKYGAEFTASLPTAGNGTLSGFRSDDFPGETLRCKSGSMSRVRGYTGFLECTSGKRVVFAILVNNYPESSQEMVRKIRSLLAAMRREF